MPLAQFPVGDFESCVQRALIDLSEVGVSPNDARVRLAVIDSVTHHEGERWHFLELRMQFPTVAGKDVYGADDGVPLELAWVDEDLQIDIGGDSENRHPIVRSSVSEMEDLRVGGTTTSWPERWCYYNGRLELWPVPDTTIHTVHFRGIVNPPKPVWRWDVDTEAFIIDGPETSVWFAGKQELMIRTFAEWLILSAVERDGQDAQNALAQYATFRAGLVQLTEEKNPVGQVEPFP